MHQNQLSPDPDSKRLSVVIPARNEEKYLPKCLKALQMSAESGEIQLEIVVVLNRCEDSTETIARQAGCLIVREDAKNLSIIRNAGVKRASSEFVATIDADSFVSPDMLGIIFHTLKNPDIIGGGVMMYPERCSLGIILTGLMLLPIALWHGIAGGLFYFRKKDFDTIGGFNETYVSVEDIEFAKRLRDHGKKTNRKFQVLWRQYIITSTRKFDTFGDWYFLRQPKMLFKLFSGKDQQAANKVWYDYEEK